MCLCVCYGSLVFLFPQTLRFLSDNNFSHNSPTFLESRSSWWNHSKDISPAGLLVWHTTHTLRIREIKTWPKEVPPCMIKTWILKLHHFQHNGNKCKPRCVKLLKIIPVWKLCCILHIQMLHNECFLWEIFKEQLWLWHCFPNRTRAAKC